MNPNVIRLRAELRRALNSGDIATAEEIALKLAPFEQDLADELDRQPSAITPMWGLLA